MTSQHDRCHSVQEKQNPRVRSVFWRFIVARLRNGAFRRIRCSLIELGAFPGTMTGTPVRSPAAIPAAPAASPPSRGIAAFFETVESSPCPEVSVMAAFSGISRTSSRVVILSRGSSFFKPLRFLYCRAEEQSRAFRGGSLCLRQLNQPSSEAAAAGKARAKRSWPFPLISHSTKKKTARKWKAEPARIKRWKSSWNVQSGERLGFFRR